MLIRFLQLLICLSSIQYGIAQIADDFSDGEISNDPLWSGDAIDFEVNVDGQLHLIAPVAGSSQLVTSSNILDKVVWEFYVHLAFNPSSSNYAQVYLTSDQPDLKGSLNGYYVMIGDTEDEISLYRQEGTTSTLVINGTDGLVASNPTVGIKVIRDQNGRWSLYHDLTGGNQYELVGSAVDYDPDVLSTGYFGFLCNYTVTRADKFYFDDVSVDQLRIDSIVVSNQEIVEVFFNQYLLESETSDITNYFIDGIDILTAVRDGIDSSKVTLSLDPSTPIITGDYMLQISNALTLQEVETYPFGYLQLKVDTTLTLSEKELLIDFNDNLDAVSAEEVTNYLVDQGVGSPISATLNTNDHSLVKLVFDQTLSDGIEYQLDISGVTNRSQNSEFTGSINFSFIVPLLIENIEVLSADSIQVFFNKTLDLPSALTSLNYFLDQGIGAPASLGIHEDSSSVYLVFAEKLESRKYELTINNLKDSDGHQIRTDSKISFSYYPIAILNLFQVDFERIAIQFNQKVDVSSAENPANYLIAEIGPPDNVNIETDNDSIVYLNYPDLVNSGYEIVVNRVENLLLNSVIDKDTLHFRFEKPTPFRAIQVNEIMADFTPAIGLPEAEYVELFNPGVVSVDLEGFLLNGEQLSAIALNANQFLVVTDDSESGLFEGINVTYLSSFDALTNSGDSVVLRDQFGNLVDSVFYTTDWYRDSEKNDGGYALEQINAELICSDDLNWVASVDEKGGTPGLSNSVLSDELDLTGPFISRIEVIMGDTLLVTFNEALSSGEEIKDQMIISAGNVLSTRQISYRDYFIFLDRELESERNHYVKISEITDCQGNQTLTDSLVFYYDVTPPKHQELSVLSDHELVLLFHEPLNKSQAEQEENYFLEGIGEPSKATLQDTASYRVHITFDSVFNVGDSYYLKVKNLGDTLINQIDSLSLSFDFQNQVDSIIAISQNLINLKLSVIPNPEIDIQSFVVSKGVGNPAKVEVDKDDPTILRLAFDNNFTPNESYTLYIQNLWTADDSGKLITPAQKIKYDTRGPRIKELIVQNDSQVVIVWDELIQLSSAFSSIQYELEGYGYPIDIEALNQQQILLTFEFEIPSEESLLIRISDIKDLFGNTTGNISRKFIYDPLPPQIVSVRLISKQEVVLQLSEKPDTSTVYIPQNFDIYGDNPVEISLSGPDSLEIRLIFEDIAEDRNQEILVAGLKDQQGNRIDSTRISFNTLDPQLAKLEFTSDSIFEIIYNKIMDSSIVDLMNYELAIHQIQFIESVSASEVKVYLRSKLQDGDSIALNLSAIKDARGHTIVDKNVKAVFNSFYQDWKLLDFKTIQLSFGTSLSAVEVDQFSMDGQTPIWAHIDAKDRNFISLIFADSLPVNQPLTLKWDHLVDLYGRRIPDREINLMIDKIPPSLVSINSEYSSQINLVFDEPITMASSSANHFDILEEVQLLDVLRISETTLQVTFDHLEDGQKYNLVIKGIGDLSDNFSLIDTMSFIYQMPYLPQYGDLIFSELMVDPTPSVGLPEIEYIELLNLSEETIHLRALIFADAIRSVSLPDYDILPGKYVVLSGELLDYQNAVEVPGFPTLDNSSDSLLLTNISGEVIDFLIYQRDWYGDTEHDDGGYSLELVNPYSDCPGIINWGASTDKMGGTPGSINAIYSERPDVVAPTILNYSFSENYLVLNYSEPMDSLSLMAATYEIANLELEKVIVSGAYSDQVKLVFATSPVTGMLYQMKIEGSFDCSGNSIEPFTISFGAGKRPTFNDILITEIMADPDPVIGLPNSEYLELYNRTNQLVSLDGVRLRDGTGEMTLPSVTLEANQYLVLVPGPSINQFIEFDHVIGVSGWRSLNNEGESLAIFYEDDLIFNIEYSDSWHANKVDGGVSLEMRDLNNLCAGANNWISSSDDKGGTPGQANSVTESIPDNFGPELTKVEVLSASGLRLKFDEILNYREITNDQIEILPGPVGIREVVLDTLIRNYLDLTLIEALVPNVNYSITIHGVSDCNNNFIQNNSLSFLLPELPDSMDVIINEVLFNPRADGVDFVEIYNRSQKNLNLEGWKLGREVDGLISGAIISLNDFILKPGEYLVLTPDVSQLKNDYPEGILDRFLQISGYPVFPNATGKVVLFDSEDNKIDAFEYHEDMHLSFLKSLEGVSLERISVDGPSQDLNNWQSASSTVGYATPGYINSQSFESAITGALSIEPRVFIPAIHGSTSMKDFTTINYQFLQTGKLANINIYNRNGQLVKNLASGISLANHGFFRWDGTTDRGSTATLGNYLVVFEVYDAMGHREILKETVVVGQ